MNEKYFRQCFRENQNTFYVQEIFFFRKSCCLCDNVEKYGTAGQTTDGNTAYAHSMPGYLRLQTHPQNI